MGSEDGILVSEDTSRDSPYECDRPTDCMQTNVILRHSFAGTGTVAVIVAWFILPEVAQRTPAEIDELCVYSSPPHSSIGFVLFLVSRLYLITQRNQTVLRKRLACENSAGISPRSSFIPTPCSAPEQRHRAEGKEWPIGIHIY